VLAGGADSRIDRLLILAYTALRLEPIESPRRRSCRARSTASATASSWAKARASWCWKKLEHAKRAAATIYAEVLAGQQFRRLCRDEARPEARGAARAINEACAKPHIDPSDVDYINAHGTALAQRSNGTVAVKRVLPDAKVLPLRQQVDGRPLDRRPPGAVEAGHWR